MLLLRKWAKENLYLNYDNENKVICNKSGLFEPTYVYEENCIMLVHTLTQLTHRPMQHAHLHNLHTDPCRWTHAQTHTHTFIYNFHILA